MNQPAPVRYTSPEECVEATLSRVGKHVVMGLPVAIGKPNGLVNSFVARALADPSIRLTIVTALSLRKPRWRSDLERRLVEPLAQRVFGAYTELEYVRLIEQGRLPDNIEVVEFFLEPGAWLGSEAFQQNYLSSNYTHVARDAHAARTERDRAAGRAPAGRRSAGGPAEPRRKPGSHRRPAAADRADACERPTVRADRPGPRRAALHVRRRAGRGRHLRLTCLEDPGTRLFCPPNAPIPRAEYSIALNVSTLVRDGGTLQLGIGELGDAIVYALQLRHQQPAIYRDVVESFGLLARHRRLIETEGGTAPFERGLYGCSEMLADGFLDLFRSGVLKRCVYASAKLQRLLDEGHIDEQVSERTLAALHEGGMRRMSFVDFHEFRDVGLFRDDVEYDRGMLVAPDGTQLRANFDDPEQRRQIARTCLGERLRNGIVADAGFFFGPKKFYEELRNMPVAQRRLFAMRAISFVNELYGHEWELKVAQRRHARFINTTMMVTGLGAAVSDALADGRVVSGVGGQYNFVAMAHALPEARSILCLRSTRDSRGEVTSSIPWSYGHATIPRHLRDIVVTEYGIADLRGRTDREVVEALLAIMDSRFQDRFVAEAQRAHKLPRDYRIPDAVRNNHPQRLQERFAPWRARDLFQDLPFGSDITPEEVVLAKALRGLQAATHSLPGKVSATLRALFADATAPRLQPYMARMALTAPQSFGERLQRGLVAVALEKALKKESG